MKTKIYTKAELKKAALLICKGKLVAFPTETVYGLGANALDKNAVKNIFKAKNRPADNPLIIHISDVKQLINYVEEVPEVAKKLIKEFWPGPCSIVFKKKKIVPDITTGGLDTVVIRMPSNKIALDLISLAGVPLAAPSANSSGKPSPTKAKHVLEDLDGKIDAIIEGGFCKKGLESTVIDVRTKPVTILRLGSLSVEKIQKCIGPVILASHTNTTGSPGMKYKHYAPKARLILIEGDKKNVDKKISLLSKMYPSAILLKRSDLKPAKLFSKLRTLNEGIVLCPSIKENHLGKTVMDRLRRAASEIIKV